MSNHQIQPKLLVTAAHDNIRMHRLIELIEFSHKLMQKIQPVVTRWNNTIWKERTYDVLSIQKENGDGTKNTRKKRHLQINNRKKKKETRVAIGAPAYRRTLNEGPWIQRKHKDENGAKQEKGSTTERRHGICKPNARRIQVRATCG